MNGYLKVVVDMVKLWLCKQLSITMLLNLNFSQCLKVFMSFFLVIMVGGLGASHNYSTKQSESLSIFKVSEVIVIKISIEHER